MPVKTLLENALDIVRNNPEMLYELIKKNALIEKTCISPRTVRQSGKSLSEQEEHGVIQYFRLQTDEEIGAFTLQSSGHFLGFDMYDLKRRKYLGTHGKFRDILKPDAFADLALEDDEPLDIFRKAQFQKNHGLVF
jgi:hypothetical protein